MIDTEIEQWVGLKQGGETYNRYLVSSLGRVYDTDKNIYISHVLTGKPQYFYVNLVNDNGDRKLRRIHNIMGWSFLGDMPNKGDTIDHIDRNKYNNSLYNLRWLSKSGQNCNKEDRTDTIKYFIRENYDHGEHIRAYNYITGLCKVSGYSLEEASYIYKLRVKYDTTSQPITFNGKITILEELCDIFGRDIAYVKQQIVNGEPLEDCFNSWLIQPINENILRLSVEFDNIWYPNKLKLSSHLKLPRDCINELLTYNNLEEYSKFLKDKEHKRQFTIQLQRERKYGKDWGDGIFGTIRGLARKYNTPEGTLWHRVQQANYTMKEALELPKGSIDHYWKLGIKHHLKSDVCSMVGLNKHVITQRMNGQGCHVMYALIPETIKGNDRSRIFILNGNAYWYNDLKHKLGVEDKITVKGILKNHNSVNEWLCKYDLINPNDNFEEIVF